jgi:hypothetical protein
MLPARHSSTQVCSVITITVLGDHDQPEWLIMMTGIRTSPKYDERIQNRGGVLMWLG